MLEDYRRRTPKSRELFERAQRVFAGGVNHNLRTFGLTTVGAYPPFMCRGEGSSLFDVDGNRYIDWWMTHFSQVLGHGHTAVTGAVAQQVSLGTHFGTLNEAQVLLAEELQRAVPFMEKMRFCTTGSEATMYAARLARLFTERPLVAKARGGWHGGNDTLGYHLKFPFSDDPFYNGVSFDFNDTDSVDALMERHGNELAAVIVEPVLGAGGGIPPGPGFLQYLREETERVGALLIFDEIITGFRFCYGSAGTGVFGVQPDLVTLGKIVAGGMPLGVYGGREDVMSLAAPGAKGGRWVGGGTFSGHPLSMVAGLETLAALKTRRDDYETLNKRGDHFRRRLNAVFEELGAPALSTGTGSIVFIAWLEHPLDPDTPLTATRLGSAVDHARLDEFQARLIEKGVFGYHGLGAMSFAHSDEDLEQTLGAVESVTVEMTGR